MLLPVLPQAYVLATIWPLKDAEPLLPAVFVNTTELMAVTPDEVAFAVQHVFVPVTRVLVVVRPGECPITVELIVLNRPDIDASILPLEGANAIFLVANVDSDLIIRPKCLKALRAAIILAAHITAGNQVYHFDGHLAPIQDDPSYWRLLLLV